MSQQPPGYPPPGPPQGPPQGYPPPGPPQGYQQPGPPQGPPPAGPPGFAGQYAAPQPPGAAPGWGAPAGPPPAKKTGKTCAIVAAVVGGLLLLVIVGVVAVGWMVVDAVKAPADQTNAYLADIKAGDTRSAYDRTCARFQAKYSYSDFVAEVEGAQERYGDLISYNVYSTNVVNDEAEVKYTLQRAQGSQTYTVDLVNEGGGWKLCEFNG